MTTFSISAQNIEDKLPYHQIPDYPELHTAGNVLARLIDGLGYRYYWATEGLTDGDLSFSPSDGARTTRQTLEHIFGLTVVILNTPMKKVNERSDKDLAVISFQELRKQTLLNLEQASDQYRTMTDKDISTLTIDFDRDGKRTSFPIWNQINGPISDAIYHVGQVVSFRRTSGNPIHSGVSVFRGKTKE